MHTPHNKLLKFMQKNMEVAQQMMREAEGMLDDIDLPDEQRQVVVQIQADIKSGKITPQEAIQRANEMIKDAGKNQPPKV